MCKHSKLSLFTGLLLVSLGIVLLLDVISDVKRKGVEMHPYDYILEVDQTDSCLRYTIYDKDHKYVGAFVNPDSLNYIIEQDNL